MAQLASESEELHQVRGWGTCDGVSPRVSAALPHAGGRGQGCGATSGAQAPVHVICPPPAQVVSSILRNLSWRADINSKKVLREVGSMTALMQCVLRATKVGRGWSGGGGRGGGRGKQPQAQGRGSRPGCLVQVTGRGDTHDRW